MLIKRKYYRYAEKEAETISLRWKVLHAFIFGLLTINAFVSILFFEAILQMFDMRCILYAQPAFTLKDVHYHPITTEATTPETFATETFATTQLQNTTKLEAEENHADNETATDSIIRVTSRPTDASTTQMQIVNDTYWYSNSSLTGVVRIEPKRTIYSSVVMCDMVVFNLLISILLSIFFCVLVVICGRGGRGNQMDILPQPWLYVYPVLIITAAMTIVSSITANTVYTGLKTFCAGFRDFTNETTCTPLVNLFSGIDSPKRNFYTRYRVCLISLYGAVILWIFQLVLTLLRVLCAVDFQYNSIVVQSKKFDGEHEETIIHEALVRSFPGVSKDKKSFLIEAEEANELQEDTTQV
ncbi:hypothetical protein NQ317_015792 [Molorchus minor]|uniref:Uncharacterized protein n=1 Tax=Molorchus minor TaxID=1323400 RepID=A0ABQ9J4B5_9CUCU|nr:hypothetical protein NQ317_015792 [Molorchus minor]